MEGEGPKGAGGKEAKGALQGFPDSTHGLRGRAILHNTHPQKGALSGPKDPKKPPFSLHGQGHVPRHVHHQAHGPVPIGRQLPVLPLSGGKKEGG